MGGAGPPGLMLRLGAETGTAAEDHAVDDAQAVLDRARAALRAAVQ